MPRANAGGTGPCTGIEVDGEAGDLTVDSTSTPADRVAEEIVTFLRARDAEARA